VRFVSADPGIGAALPNTARRSTLRLDDEESITCPIRVHVISCTLAGCDNAGSTKGSQEEIFGVPLEKVKEAALACMPLRRFLKPGEIADLAVCLGSAESDGMTGQPIVLDAGTLVV